MRERCRRTSRALPFDDPTVIARYRALIDQVLPYLNSSVKYISLGNEVDTYLTGTSSEWTAYKALIEDARTYIRQKKPNIKVGVTTTFDGFIGNASAQTAVNIASLNANMDVIILTYYPTGVNFVPRDPSTVSTDMAAMVTKAGGKPLVMQEWGYPSSSILSPLPLNSEQMQAGFHHQYLYVLETIRLQPHSVHQFFQAARLGCSSMRCADRPDSRE